MLQDKSCFREVPQADYGLVLVHEMKVMISGALLRPHGPLLSPDLVALVFREMGRVHECPPFEVVF